MHLCRTVEERFKCRKSLEVAGALMLIKIYIDGTIKKDMFWMYVFSVYVSYE